MLRQLVMLLKDCGYQYFKVSRLFGTAVGPLGDKAGWMTPQWRKQQRQDDMGVAAEKDNWIYVEAFWFIQYHHPSYSILQRFQMFVMMDTMMP